MQTTDSFKLHSLLLQEFQANKMPQVHFKMAVYLYYIVSHQIESLNEEVAQLFLEKAISSQNPEARATGRRAFLIWQQFNENSAARVFQKLDYNAQKAICDEADQWQVLFMSQEPSAFQSH